MAERWEKVDGHDVRLVLCCETEDCERYGLEAPVSVYNLTAGDWARCDECGYRMRYIRTEALK